MRSIFSFFCLFSFGLSYSFCQNHPTEIFTFVEEEAAFVGGAAAFSEYLQHNIVYPKSAIHKNKQGKCFLKFIVNENGSISDVTVQRGVPNCPECDAAAVKVIESMPRWIPAKMKGKPVRCWINIPISFTLPKN